MFLPEDKEGQKPGVLFIVSSSESNTLPGTQQVLKYLLEKLMFRRLGTLSPHCTGAEREDGAQTSGKEPRGCFVG